MKAALITAIVVATVSGRELAVDLPPRINRADRSLLEAVVYAEVTSVEVERHGWYADVTLNVKCTLTGPYDAAGHPVLIARMGLLPPTFGGPRKREAPKRKSPVVVLLHSRTSPGGNGSWYIPWIDSRSPVVGGSGEKSGAVEVTGFDDPKVAEIIARLREIRKKAADATKGADGTGAAGSAEKGKEKGTGAYIDENGAAG